MHLSLEAVNQWVSHLLLPLGIWILLSGLDDLFVDAVAFLARRRSVSERGLPSPEELTAQPESRIAILTPLWRESSVIGRMVQRNTQNIAYKNYHFFIGAYPNDPETVSVIRQLERQYPQVHLALCPHGGPTSKADCLNWIYQRLLLYERERSLRFDIIVTHDAEDVIHPASLQWINYYCADHQMVQVPVLPLPIPKRKLVQGLYGDEFTEYQARDMPARHLMGAFVPSNGVGTGFRRDALEALAAAGNNHIFEPACLTEDYENGLRLHRAGAKQKFLPVQNLGIATREFFPETFRSAIRQRTRWVTGICLQTWDRHGWQGGFVQKYWLWRDRKGLAGNPLSLAANLLFAYGAIGYAAGCPLPWHPIFGLSAAIGIYRTLYRMRAVSVTFGYAFAALVPVRTVCGNVINSVATMRALSHFARSKLLGRPLVWLKTEHSYPSQLALRADSRILGEILVRSGRIQPWQLDQALAGRAPGDRLGETLLRLGYLTEDDLYEALSRQHGIPQSRIDPEHVPAAVARSLPAEVARQWNLLPCGVEFGNLVVAVTEAPCAEAEQSIRKYTALGVRFLLVTPENHKGLTEALL